MKKIVGFLCFISFILCCQSKNNKKSLSKTEKEALNIIRNSKFYKELRDDSLSKIIKHFNYKDEYHKRIIKEFEEMGYTKHLKQGILKVCKISENTWVIHSIDAAYMFYECCFSYIDIVDDKVVVVSDTIMPFVFHHQDTIHPVAKAINTQVNYDLRVIIKNGKRFVTSDLSGARTFHPLYWKIEKKRNKYEITKSFSHEHLPLRCICKYSDFLKYE